MSKQNLPPDFLKRLKNLKSKRARIVAEHILTNGFITTDDIRDYGYKDPYRPTQDIRDEGIPLESFKMKDAQGRTISAYKFGDPAKTIEARRGGRKNFSKKFKKQLISIHGCKCAICLIELEQRYLQIDHCIPYQVAGDIPLQKPGFEYYMLLCRSCNRAKSWSCENCDNFLEHKDAENCKTCYWAKPDTYQHIALRKIRRLDIVWSEEEVSSFEELSDKAVEIGQNIPEYIKTLISQSLRNL